MMEEGILQLVHSDVFGPVSVPSLGKYVYFVSFIDDDADPPSLLGVA
jgi:hypothetical protein